MHLLNTSTIKLYEFVGSRIPSYAILSHKWDTSEVSFADMRAGRAETLAGYEKVKSFCAQAASDGWQYVWMDSCCIDKSSSAELTEAINSMFDWYRYAQVCYAYLSDVPSGPPDHYLENSPFRNSKWFTRGWTLQELLAPSTLEFFNRDWKFMGTKVSLSEEILSATGIDVRKWGEACVAQKMSWASSRETTRVEDEAYCLMGLFGVNMPPLYGEGRKAFIRLQLEILRTIDDESIFAWTGEFNSSAPMLAESPAAFKNSGNVCRRVFDRNRPPYTVTNKGLSIELHLIDAGAFTWAAPLNCWVRESDEPLSMLLRRIYRDEFIRIIDNDLTHIESLSDEKLQNLPRKHVFIKLVPDAVPQVVDGLVTKNNFTINPSSLLLAGFNIFETFVSEGVDSFWVYPVLVVVRKKGYRRFAALLFASKSRVHEMFALVIDFSSSHTGVNMLLPQDESLQVLRNTVKLCMHDSYGPSSDRVSERLKSGRSVSVALRKRYISGGLAYIVDVTLDESGHLP